jgi:transposase-like protein
MIKSKSLIIKEAICDTLAETNKKLVQEQEYEGFYCFCPYCGEDIGCIEDPGYYFARTEPPICLCCGKEFEVEDKLRPKGYDKKKGKT